MSSNLPPHSGHHILKCKKCNSVVQQCRCIDLNKVTYYTESCNNCNNTKIIEVK